ncbi:MAG: lipoprotein-releasing system ATP-binding protein LolD, partial [Candidatus Dadabacteria bacterium]|nr:lipoprotein-releasing system ATP-binding protein LolD [Candidatus Dadabacteria bacterium]
RALVTRPQCILADEPTGNLDEHTAEQVFNVMLELNQDYDTSLVMVTHNLELARQLDIIFELRDGQIHEHTI